tara:strand:+ start:899 stop:1099 length:201 start_codon:yes stop_codon:yes gene_type:complete
MAEEKKEQKKDKSSKALVKLVIGLVFVLVGLLMVFIWKRDLGVIIRGCLGIFLIMAGAITIAIAKE